MATKQRRFIMLLLLLLIILMSGCKSAYSCLEREARPRCEQRLEGTGISAGAFQAAFDTCHTSIITGRVPENMVNLKAACYAEQLNLDTGALAACINEHGYSSREEMFDVLICVQNQ